MLKVLVKPSYTKIRNELKEQLSKVPEKVPVFNPNTHGIQHQVDMILKVIFKEHFQMLLQFDDAKKILYINRSFINLLKLSDKKVEHVINYLKELLNAPLILKVQGKNQKQIIDEFKNNYNDWKFENINVAPTPDAITSYTTEERQDVLAKESIDNTYLLVHKRSVKEAKVIDTYINRFARKFNSIVTNRSALKERGVIFNLKALLFPQLFILFMEKDQRYSLPVVFSKKGLWEGQDTVNNLDLFLSHNIKIDDTTKRRTYLVIDSYSLQSNNFDIEKCYEWTKPEITSIMDSICIPRTQYNAFNTTFVMEQAKEYHSKYGNKSHLMIFVQNRRFVVMEVAPNVEDTYLKQDDKR